MTAAGVPDAVVTGFSRASSRRGRLQPAHRHRRPRSDDPRQRRAGRRRSRRSSARSSTGIHQAFSLGDRLVLLDRDRRGDPRGARRRGHAGAELRQHTSAAAETAADGRRARRATAGPRRRLTDRLSLLLRPRRGFGPPGSSRFRGTIERDDDRAPDLPDPGGLSARADRARASRTAARSTAARSPSCPRARCAGSATATSTSWSPTRRPGSSRSTIAVRTCRRRCRSAALEGCVVACPLHEGRFDLCSGDVVQMPTTGGLDADGATSRPGRRPGKEPKVDPPGKKAEARRLTRVRRLRYYPVRIVDGRIEVTIPA